MKLVTYNIRVDCKRDGENNYEFRSPFIEETLRAKDPDIVCFQEVLPHVAVDIRHMLPAHTVIGIGRGAELDGEQMTVAFKKDRFDLIEMRTYWLSETPFLPGTRYEGQSHCPRCATEALLRDTVSGKVFRLTNTHLDHVSEEVRVISLRQVLTRLENTEFFPDVPMLLCGDFNAAPGGRELSVFSSFPAWTDLTKDMGCTFHDYGRRPDGEQIDYIFGKGSWNILSREKWTDTKGGLYLSDHYPVAVELE